jgi:RES domain-containing protein
MLLWRLSGVQHAEAFDGGYGLLFEGRWNTLGHAVTYCATSPSLCVLEKLVHVEDPTLLPELDLVTYDVPDDTGIDIIGLDDLPANWRHRLEWTQQKGDDWYRLRSNALLFVPSVIVAVRRSPDLNVLINHSHPDAAAIRISGLTPFAFDPRQI